MMRLTVSPTSSSAAAAFRAALAGLLALSAAGCGFFTQDRRAALAERATAGASAPALQTTMADRRGLADAISETDLGARLTLSDLALMAETTQDALEKGASTVTVTWTNPTSGAAGAVTPEPPYLIAGDVVCRNYSQTVIYAGQTAVARGAGCRSADGLWSEAR